jgi:hypothetical protein
MKERCGFGRIGGHFCVVGGREGEGILPVSLDPLPAAASAAAPPPASPSLASPHPTQTQTRETSMYMSVQRVLPVSND